MDNFTLAVVIGSVAVILVLIGLVVLDKGAPGTDNGRGTPGAKGS